VREGAPGGRHYGVPDADCVSRGAVDVGTAVSETDSDGVGVGEKKAEGLSVRVLLVVVAPGEVAPASDGGGGW
jgi:hypothetical protein